MTDIVIKPETGHIYITPVGFWVYAEDYLAASVNWKSPREYSPVPYFAVCRSIELALKAFLLSKGVRMPEIRNPKTISHNLMFALAKAEQLSLSDLVLTTDAEKRELSKGNEHYKQDKKRFEYFDIENLRRVNLPDLSTLQDYAARLLKDTRDFILSSA